jgi:type III secretion protein N (ATPase)
MDAVISEAHRRQARHLRDLLHRQQDVEFLVQVGEYKAGADPRTDEALAKADALRAFLCQGTAEQSDFQETAAWLARLTG